MVNNNTQQKTNKSSSISESSIYLKKSELPKDISSFRNDVGYISSSALSNWLKEHSYISKSEISELIRRANLTVVDRINKSYDDDAIARLNADIEDIKGEIIAIKDAMKDIESGSISPELFNDFATKDWVEGKGYLTTHQSLSSYAKKSDIPNTSNFATKDEIPSLDGIATKDWVEGKGFLTSHQSLSGYVKKSELPSTANNIATKDDIPSLDGYATKDWVEGKGYLTSHQSLSKYAKKSEIPDVSNFVTKDEMPSLDGLATKDWVEGKGYLTTHQSLAKYAKKSELPDVSNFVTRDWIQEQGFISDVQGLEDYAKKSDLTGFLTSSDLAPYAKKNSVYDINHIDTFFLSKEEAGSIYPTKEDADDKYLSKRDARKTYLNIEDYKGLKDATVLSREYNDKTLEELMADVDVLKNGFYVVDYDDIVVIENHEIVRLFDKTIEWIEEE